MHSTQRAYLKAKADFEAAQAAARAEMPPWPVPRGQQMTEAQIDQVIEIEMCIEDKYQVTAKMDAMIQARKDLLSWAKETVASEMAGHPRLAEALEVFDKAPHHPRVLPKVIDAALRLRV